MLEEICSTHTKTTGDACWPAWFPETGVVFACTNQDITTISFEGEHVGNPQDINVIGQYNILPYGYRIDDILEIQGVRFNTRTGECIDVTQT
jgi:hypothetical protein